MDIELIDTAPAIVYGDDEEFVADASATITTPDRVSEREGLETGPFPAELISALVAE